MVDYIMVQVLVALIYMAVRVTVSTPRDVIDGEVQLYVAGFLEGIMYLVFMIPFGFVLNEFLI